MSIKAEELSRLEKIASRPYFLKKNFLSTKGLNVPYAKYRVLRPFLKLYYKSFKKVKGPTPWTSPASIEIFENFLDTTKTGFEWGSGSSTVFLAKKLKNLVSVEHNKKWFEKVSGQIKKDKLTNIDYHFVEVNYPEKHLDKDGFEVAFTEKQIQAYKAYYSLIDRYADDYFDLILIDGRARVKCGEHAVPKLKSGGLLVLDNSERIRYNPLKKALEKWPSIWTTNGLTDTTIWIKPKP